MSFSIRERPYTNNEKNSEEESDLSSNPSISSIRERGLFNQPEKPSLDVFRTLARGAETALGLPRESAEFLQSLVPEKALIAGAKKIGLGEGAENLIDITKKYAPYKLLPKIQDVKNLNKWLFKGNLEPKNDFEKFSDDIVSDFVALSMPLPGSKSKIVKSFVTSLTSNLLKEGVGLLGGSDTEKQATKVAAMFFSSLINPKGAEKFKNELYEKARNSRPQNAQISASNLSQKLKNLSNQLLKGGNAPSKTKTLEKISEIESKINNNKINVDELEEFKKTINEARSGLYAEFQGNKLGKKLAKANLDNISKIIDDGLLEYGKQNPIWESFYRPANEAHGAIQSSKQAARFIGKHVGKMSLVSPTTGVLLFELGVTPLKAGLVGGAGIPAAYTGIKTGEIITQIMKSPVLRKYYTRMIQAALQEDAVRMSENLKKLDQNLSNEKFN